MAKTKLSLADMPIPQKIEFARQIVKSMTGNANFTTPNPTFSVVGTGATTLETAYNDANVAEIAQKLRLPTKMRKKMHLTCYLQTLAAMYKLLPMATRLK